MKLNYVLIGFLTVAALLVVGLLIKRDKFKIQVRLEGVQAVHNPLEVALDEKASAPEFEKLVRKFPQWINHIDDNQGAINVPVLVTCAVLELTNHIRILITNGADVEGAVKSATPYKWVDEIARIRAVDREVQASKSKTP